MTAMNSRFGLRYYGPQKGNVVVFGNLELDFYDTASDNSQKPRMRHAYVELQSGKWGLLAGQTWDIFGPLGSSSLNTNGWLWNGGNIGFRRPQIRVTKNCSFGGSNLVTQISVNRNIGVATSGSVNAGENSGAPLSEGRIAYSFPVFGKKSTVGIAGLYGVEKINRGDGTSYEVPESGVALDCSVSFGSKLSVKGEYFQGSNLDSLLAGIGQGINTTKEEGIDTTGGWAQVSFKPICGSKCSINVGYGAEELDKGDLNSGDRVRNKVIFANIIGPIYDDVKLGLEYSKLRTKYVDTKRGENNRATASFIYSF
jgi:hypothetical protein